MRYLIILTKQDFVEIYSVFQDLLRLNCLEFSSVISAGFLSASVHEIRVYVCLIYFRRAQLCYTRCCFQMCPSLAGAFAVAMSSLCPQSEEGFARLTGSGCRVGGRVVPSTDVIAPAPFETTLDPMPQMIKFKSYQYLSGIALSLVSWITLFILTRLL